MTGVMEYIGEMMPDGRLTIDPSVAKKLSTGQKLKIKIQQLPAATKTQGTKEPDPATLRILERMNNAPQLGLIHGTLSREEIYGDRIDERY